MAPVALTPDEWAEFKRLRALDSPPLEKLGWNNIDDWLDYLEAMTK